MCGRVTMEFDVDTVKSMLKNFFHVKESHIHDFRPSYNIGPTESVVAIVSDGKQLRGGTLKWGLVPSWAKDIKYGSKMINARCETISEKPSYKNAFLNRRCVIVASGFYEWDKTSKQPYRFVDQQQPLIAMAGIWEKNVKLSEHPLYTCSIVTTKANDWMKRVHHRMPVMLKGDEINQWLDKSTPQDTFNQLFDMSNKPLKMYPVSSIVNSVKNDGPECIEPIKMSY